MGTNANAAQQTQTAPKKLVMKVEPEEFKGTLKTELTTTMDLASMVNSFFRPIFADYEGCTVLPDVQTGQLQLSLFFKDKGEAAEGMVKNIINAVKTQGITPMDRIRNMNIRNNNRVYELSDQTKDIISDFIWTRQNQKPNWPQLIFEVSEQGYSGYSIYVKVTGLDIIRFLKKKFGNKSDAGGYNDYAISIIKPLNQFYSGENSNYLVSILQLDNKKVEELCQKIGMIPVQGNIPMVRS